MSNRSGGARSIRELDRERKDQRQTGQGSICGNVCDRKNRTRDVKQKGIEQLSDVSAIEKLSDEVIAANPKATADFKAGNIASLNFLKGQVIKLSKGKANPQ